MTRYPLALALILAACAGDPAVDPQPDAGSLPSCDAVKCPPAAFCDRSGVCTCPMPPALAPRCLRP